LTDDEFKLIFPLQNFVRMNCWYLNSFIFYLIRIFGSGVTCPYLMITLMIYLLYVVFGKRGVTFYTMFQHNLKNTNVVYDV